MKEPNWINVEVLLAIHSEIIFEHGGIAGIRDRNLLESTCAASKQLYHYSNPKPTICALAAHHAFSLTRNHPFRDGNKRMSALICELFLELNHYTLSASDEEAYFIFLDLAAGTVTELELMHWLDKNCQSALASA